MNLDIPAEPFCGSMGLDEFMAFVDTRPGEEHWELIEGVAVRMSPVTLAHRKIAYNLSTLLNATAEARKRDLFAYCNVAVRSPGVRNFQAQPDVAVVPGVAGYDLYAERFQLVAEILSPTNTGQEIDLKLPRYREAPDNLYVVVIEPREFRVEIHARRSSWHPAILTKSDDAIEMPEFGLRCGIADLYRDTPLDPQRAGLA